MPREITEQERLVVQESLQRARAAMCAIADYDQAHVDKLCQAVAWAAGNEVAAGKLGKMSVEESGMGDPSPGRRLKILGVLRDALRQKSIGVIEEDPVKGIVKYAKPAGVIASLIPVTNPYVTPAGIAIYAIKCKDAVIFSPHPASKKTTTEAVRMMRAALSRQGAPADILQCLEKPSIPLAQELMSICDLTIATGGQAMVRAAYSSGKPAYGVGAGNATMVIDETADIEDAARNTRISKTNDNGSGCSADGNVVVASSIYDQFLAELQREGGYLVNEEEKKLLRSAYWDAEGHRTPETIARPAQRVAELAGFPLPADKTFLIVREENIGKQHLFSTEKLGIVLSIFKYSGFDMALDMVRQHLRSRRKRPLLRHLFLRRRSYPPPGAGRARQPHDGAATPVEIERRQLHQRHADDLQHGLRHLGWQHHQRKHRPEALHERHLGEPSDSRRPPERAGVIRRVL